MVGQDRYPNYNLNPHFGHRRDFWDASVLSNPDRCAWVSGSRWHPPKHSADIGPLIAEPLASISKLSVTSDENCGDRKTVEIWKITKASNYLFSVNFILWFEVITFFSNNFLLLIIDLFNLKKQFERKSFLTEVLAARN